MTTELLSGSHEVEFEARALTAFQEGDDPDGTELGIVEGEVELDGTADVRGTMELTVPGRFGQDGPVAFPRGSSTLLAPFGNEVFVRRGVNLGLDGIQWKPLGYYRIVTPQQEDAPDGTISLTCEDRMGRIRRSRLLRPRAYSSGTSVSDIFDDLVGDIYPQATITFDDASGASTLGRQLIIEKDRYKGLYDLATSLGKIMFWDGAGILQVQDAPDEGDVVWEVAAGPDGVLVNSARQVSADGVHNAWVVTGEGGDTNDPVRGVAVDANPQSPTYFYVSGDDLSFGQVPRFFSSPFITTSAQAEAAAAAGLRRTLGVAYDLNFEAVPNQALQPYEAVRVTQSDGNRDVHIVTSLTLPLNAEDVMTAQTRQKAVVFIGR